MRLELANGAVDFILVDRSGPVVLITVRRGMPVADARRYVTMECPGGLSGRLRRATTGLGGRLDDDVVELVNDRLRRPSGSAQSVA